MSFPWHITLLGGLKAICGDQEVAHFRSQKIGTLLGYLALFPHRTHSREELADLLWPDADLDAARMNLRTALSSLRRALEGADLPPPGSVLITEGRLHVRLNPDAVVTDVARFEAAIRSARTTGTDEEALRGLAQAVEAYGGPLLPGRDELWALTERERLDEEFRGALARLVRGYEQRGDPAEALGYARRAVAANPLREEAHADVIRLLMAQGQLSAARRQHEELARRLDAQRKAKPSPAVHALLHAPVATPAPRTDAGPPTPASASSARPSGVSGAAATLTLPAAQARGSAGAARADGALAAPAPHAEPVFRT